MRHVVWLSAAVITVALAFAASAETVQVINRTTPVLCAEVDNVDFRLAGEGPIGFRVEATHPGYIETLTADDTKPVWDNCEGFDSEDPVYEAEPIKLTLYEDERWLLTGLRKPSFWRPGDVPVHVAGETFADLHLIQLHRKRDERFPVEVLVLYPPDGYWRPKPMPPANFVGKNKFGSSFLVGPVEDELRPFVVLDAVTFVPEAGRFDLAFARGGTGTLTLSRVDDAAVAVDVALDIAWVGEIAALRSMFVTTSMSDTAVVQWRDSAGGAHSGDVLTAVSAPVREISFLRTEPSNHNISAPDVSFRDFGHPLGGG